MPDINELVNLLKANARALTSIELLGNNLGAEGANSIAEALKTNTTLTSIRLHYNNIGVAGANSIAEVLKTNTTLTSIELAGNNLGAEGANSIAEALKTNTTLTSINLWNNNIGAEGANLIAEALKTNTTLTSINLVYNNLGAEGANSIAEALKTNTTLTSINLESNNLGAEGANSIAEALKTNTTLTSIRLFYNNIGDEGANSIAEALKTNFTLTSIYLWYNNISSSLEKEVQALLDRNKAIAGLEKEMSSLEASEKKPEEKLAQLVEIGEMVNQFLEKHPECSDRLTPRFSACYGYCALEAGDGLMALEHINEKASYHTALAEWLYAVDIESDSRYKDFGLTSEDKIGAMLGLLSLSYADNNSQRLIQNVIGQMVNGVMTIPNVELIIPESILQSIINALGCDKKIEAMKPQDIFVLCQIKAVKDILTTLYNTSSVITMESTVRFNKEFKFPLVVNVDSSQQAMEIGDTQNIPESKLVELIKNPVVGEIFFESLEKIKNFAADKNKVLTDGSEVIEKDKEGQGLNNVHRHTFFGPGEDVSLTSLREERASNNVL